MELARDVAAEDAGLKRLDVPPDVRLRLQQVAAVHVLFNALVLVGAHHVHPKRLHLPRAPSSSNAFSVRSTTKPACGVQEVALHWS